MLYDSVEPLLDRRIYEQLVYTNMIQMQANAAEDATISWDDAQLKYDQAPTPTAKQTPTQIFNMFETMRATLEGSD